jgi:rhamnogalacturonan acetylesterase
LNHLLRSKTGWGDWLPYSLSLSLVNKAIGGRSARSFTVENRFAEISKLVQPGDFVVIEFGHNYGGSPKSNDNGRSDCPGTRTVTCTFTNGTVVKTFDAYMSEAAEMFVKLGAYVVISSQTPNNPWEGGNFSYVPGRFVSGAALAVKNVGSVNVTLVDHGQYVANAFKALGKEAVDAMYPNDHTHTNAAGADVVSRAFVKSLVCGLRLRRQLLMPKY